MNGCSDGCSTDRKRYIITGISDLWTGLKIDANGIFEQKSKSTIRNNMSRRGVNAWLVDWNG